MKVIKQDFSKNHSRVVKRFAFLPKKIYVFGKGFFWIFWRSYYQLQLDSYWGKGWLRIEESFNKNSWDYKWDEKYLASCRMSEDDEKSVKLKYPPMYQNSFTENDLP